MALASTGGQSGICNSMGVAYSHFGGLGCVKVGNLLQFSYLCFQFVGTCIDGFDDPTDLLSIVSTLLMILLNAHNILGVASILIEAPTLEEFNMHMEEGVRHIDNIYSTSITALYFFN